MTLNARRIGIYLLGAFGLSWGLAAAFFATGLPLKSTPGLAMAVAYMFGPAAAVWLAGRFGPVGPWQPLGMSWRWNRYFVVAWLGPLALAFAALGVGLLMPGVTFSPGMEGMFERFATGLPPEQVAQIRQQMAALPIPPIWLLVGQGLLAGVTVNAVAGLGEELGWRGLMQAELAPLGFWRASWLIGLVWGVWHAPIIARGHNYPQHPWLGIGLMVAFCVLLSPLFGWIRLRSGSVLAAAVAHGTLNATGGLAIVLLAGGNDLTVGVTGAAGLLVLGVANLALWAGGRRGAR